MICAIRSVVNPNETEMKTKKNIRETPVTISALSIGMFKSFIDMLLFAGDIFAITKAIYVPKIVAITEAAFQQCLNKQI